MTSTTTSEGWSGKFRVLRATLPLHLPDESGPLPDIVLLSGSESRRLLRSLRATAATALLPVFLEEPADGPSNEIADGNGLSPGRMEEIAEDIHIRLKDLDIEAVRDSLDLRMLAYLHSRPWKRLLPVISPLSPGVYTWPLADALSGGLLETDAWIDSLLERALIQEGDLIERVRFCPRCDGGHLNYVDICPFCRSMNIVQVPFIHCFTCGRVGPQDVFFKAGELQCPFCGTKLRHIGSDYDRPMENYLCNDCSKSFAEPEVSARCLLCGNWSITDELVPKNFRMYSLSDKGILAARTGTIEDVYSILDTLNYMKPQPFMHILDWMLKLASRPPVEPFCVMLLSFPGFDRFIEQKGGRVAMEVLGTITRRLRDMIRSTDVSTRTEQGDLLLLLPKTPLEGGRVLSARIMALSDLAVQPDGTRIELDLKMTSIPEDLNKEEEARFLIARLRGESSF